MSLSLFQDLLHKSTIKKILDDHYMFLQRPVAKDQERPPQHTEVIKPANTGEQRPQDGWLKRRRITLIARYGSIFHHASSQLCTMADSLTVTETESLHRGLWAEFASILDVEDGAYPYGCGTKYRRHIKKRLAQLTRTTTAAAHPAWIQHDILATLEILADRFELLHDDDADMFRESRFAKLAESLFNDFCDAPCPPKAEGGYSRGIMAQFIEGMIDRWFERDPENPMQYQAWRATNELRKLAFHLHGAKNKAASYRFVLPIIIGTARQMTRAEAESKLETSAEENFEHSAGRVNLRRVASEELEAETARTKRQRRD